MAAFSESILLEKLSKVYPIGSVSTLNFIQSLRPAGPIISTPFLYHLAGPNRLLALLYLCNDVLQRTRRDGPNFTNAFINILPDAILHIWSQTSSSTHQRVKRLLQVWLQRRIFEPSFINGILQTLDADSPNNRSLNATPSTITTHTNTSPLSPLVQTLLQSLITRITQMEPVIMLQEALQPKFSAIPPQIVSGTTETILALLSNPDSAATTAQEVTNASAVATSYATVLEQAINMRTSLISALRELINQQESLVTEQAKMLIEAKETAAKVSALNLDTNAAATSTNGKKRDASVIEPSSVLAQTDVDEPNKKRKLDYDSSPPAVQPLPGLSGLPSVTSRIINPYDDDSHAPTVTDPSVLSALQMNLASLIGNAKGLPMPVDLSRLGLPSVNLNGQSDVSADSYMPGATPHPADERDNPYG